MTSETSRVLDMLQEGKIDADEAERLLDVLYQNRSQENARSSSVVQTEVASSTRRPKFLRVLIVDGDSEKVDVRVPLKLVRLGMPLAEAMPEGVRETISEQGIDLSKLSDLDDDDFYEALGELRVDIVDDESTVRVFCE